jgi:hypothetical protein
LSEEKSEEKPKAPALGTGQPNPTDWVFYLQQMLNFKYQMQVVEENGTWDAATANAVAHFREYYGLGSGDTVDKKTWKELGHEDEKLENVDKPATLVEEPDSDLCWASAIATVLKAKGGDHTVEKVCEEAGTGKTKQGYGEVSMFAQDKFHLAQTGVKADSAASWSKALKGHGPVLSPTSTDHHILVVAGIRAAEGDEEKVEIHVLDPISKQDKWLKFQEEFLETYNPPTEPTLFGVG